MKIAPRLYRRICDVLPIQDNVDFQRLIRAPRDFAAHVQHICFRNAQMAQECRMANFKRNFALQSHVAAGAIEIDL